MSGGSPSVVVIVFYLYTQNELAIRGASVGGALLC